MSGRLSLPPLSLRFPVSKSLLLTGIIAWDILLSLSFGTWFQIISSILHLPYRPHLIVKTVIAIKVISYLFLNPYLFPPLLCKLSSLMYGPLSIDNFKYYVIFVDHFTYYIWLYPLKRKSYVSLVFPRFKTLVENLFKQKIITLYSDNGGEYTGLSTFLTTHGISHHTSPPHTPKHNGFFERRHRHIVETGLALLSRASLSLSFWSYAFLTATSLINRLPTPTLQMSSPYHKLFDSSQSFRTSCLHLLHKLAPRSTPCVFLGYSLNQSAYICFDPSTTKTYHSRHVRFIESIFPLSGVNNFLPRFDEPTVSTRFPVTLIDSTPPSTTLAADPTSHPQHLVLSSPLAIVDLPNA